MKLIWEMKMNNIFFYKYYNKIYNYYYYNYYIIKLKM